MRWKLAIGAMAATIFVAGCGAFELAGTSEPVVVTVGQTIAGALTVCTY